jgi:hypothetical protein
VDVIVERWQKLTGKEATLDGDGATFQQVQAKRTAELEAARAPNCGELLD